MAKIKQIAGSEGMQRKLAEVARKLSRPASLKVGFLAGATYPNGQSVAEVAVFQNYGTKNIPPRPFFTNVIAKGEKRWPAALAKIVKQSDYDPVRSLQLMGEGIKGDIQQSIIDTNAPPLAESTVARKGFAKPLIDTGQMLDSVDWEVTVE